MDEQNERNELKETIRQQLLIAFETLNETLLAGGQSPAVTPLEDDRTFERGIDLQRFKKDPELRATTASYFAQDYIHRYGLDRREQVTVELGAYQTLTVRFRE